MRRLIACVVAAALAGPCGARAESLVIATSRGPVSLPLYVADAEGYFKQEGVEVQLRECTSGRACLQSLSDGHADVATGAELLVALSSFTRADLAVIATISTSSLQIKLIARRVPGTPSATQLKGKRIGTVFGTSAQYFLDSWLTFNEIDPRQVTMTRLAPDQVVKALQHGEVDAVAIWEPEASAAAAALADEAWVLPNPRVYTQHFSLITTRTTISLHTTTLVKMLRALIRAQAFIADEPGAAKAVLRARLALAQDVDDGMKEHDFRIRLDQSLMSTMDSQVRWAVQQGLGDAGSKPHNLLHWIEPSLLRGVAPRAIGLAQ